MAKGIKKEIVKEINSISDTAIIELFRLYYNYQEDPQAILHFHGGTNNVRSSIYFDDQEYIALPIEGEGFEILGDQRLPRPKIKISNAGLYMSSILRKYKNLNNAKIERRRIFAKFLDDRNFDGGVNPWGMANPNARMPDDKYFVNSKVAENKLFVELELVSSLELENNEIPAREVAARYCPWVYRGEGCRYGSTSSNILGDVYSDRRDRPVSDVNDQLFVIQDSATTWKLNPDIFPTIDSNYIQGKNNISSQYYGFGCLRNRGLWNQKNKIINPSSLTSNLIDLSDSNTFDNTYGSEINTIDNINSTYSLEIPTSPSPIDGSTYVVFFNLTPTNSINSKAIYTPNLNSITFYVYYPLSPDGPEGGDPQYDELYFQYTAYNDGTWNTIGAYLPSTHITLGEWNKITISENNIPKTATWYYFRFAQGSAGTSDAPDHIVIALPEKTTSGAETQLFDDSGNTKYVPGDYVYTVSKRVEEGRNLTSNFYKNQRVYYVCRKTHTVSADKYPPLNSEYWVKDSCSKKIGGCKLRYNNEEYANTQAPYDGLNNNKSLKFGGFPGVDMYEY